MKAWWRDAEDDRARGPTGTAWWTLTIAWIVVVVAWVLIFVVCGDADGRGPASHVLVGMTPGATFGVDVCGTPLPPVTSDARGIVEFEPPEGVCPGGGTVTVSRAAQGVRARCHVRER